MAKIRIDQPRPLPGETGQSVLDDQPFILKPDLIIGGRKYVLRKKLIKAPGCSAGL